jgi:hypothetical protein
VFFRDIFGLESVVCFQAEEGFEGEDAFPFLFGDFPGFGVFIVPRPEGVPGAVFFLVFDFVIEV